MSDYRYLRTLGHETRTELWVRLQRIRAEAKAELDRIERHGGDAGFALRVEALAGGDDG